MNLGELAPGDSKSVRVTFNTHDAGDVRIEAEASAWCGTGEDAQRVAIATQTQTQQTELISLPALALSVIDVQDPVRLGEEETASEKNASKDDNDSNDRNKDQK